MTIFYVAIGVLCIVIVSLSCLYGRLLRKYKCLIDNMNYYTELYQTVDTPPCLYKICRHMNNYEVLAKHMATYVDAISVVKSYPFDENDPESKDFALRNAEELVEILKREVV